MNKRYDSTNIHSQNWALAIRRIKSEDNGTYKCQTSSHPPRFLLTHLHAIGTNPKNYFSKPSQYFF